MEDTTRNELVPIVPIVFVLPFHDMTVTFLS